MSQEESKPKSDESTSTEQTAWEWMVPEDGVYEAYSNFVYVNWTPLDVRIRFAQIIPEVGKPPQAGRWVIEESVAMTLAWGHAKFLRDTLNDVIQRYEKANGEIITPKMPT
jgi:hypothetical protein